jgi:hypothetical protein
MPYYPPPGIEDKHYVHLQNLAASTWIVVHNLDKHPAITVVDSAGTLVEGDLQHDSLNQATLTFSAPFSGAAYCN